MTLPSSEPSLPDPPELPARGGFDWREHAGLSVVAAVLTAMLTFGAMVIAAVAVFALSGLLGVGSEGLVGDPGWMLAGAASQQLTLLVMIPLLLKLFQLRGAEVFPRRSPGGLELLGTLVLLLGLLPFVDLAAGFAQQLSGAESASTAVVRLAANSPLPLFLLYLLVAAVLPGIAEEALFRGVILGFFLPRRPWLGLFVSTLLFAAVHGELVQGFGTFVLGLGFGIARLRTGSMWPSMIAHALFNGTVLSVARYSGMESESAPPPGQPSVALLIGGVVLFLAGWQLLSLGSRMAVATEPR